MGQAANINPHLKPLEQALAARFGWQTASSWRDSLRQALSRKAGKLGVDELLYCRMAISSPAELETLAELVINSETRFFREQEQFEALSNQVLPELMTSRASTRRLDMWSAACSTGEEAYSLAMIVSEALSPAEHWKTNLVATDLRGSAIMAACRGSYSASSIRTVPSGLRTKYFTNIKSSGREAAFDIRPSLKKMVTFRRANVYDSQFWKNINQQFDLILCNNLLLYFHALAVKQTVERIANILRRGGMLMVMKNESGYIDHPLLKLETSLPGAFFRKT